MKLNDTINSWTLIEIKEEKINNAKTGLFKCKCDTEKIHRISSVKSRRY